MRKSAYESSNLDENIQLHTIYEKGENERVILT